MKFKFISAILSVVLAFAGALHAQQPQTQTAPISAVNAKYVNGVGLGYWSVPATGLTLNVSAGTNFCSGVVTHYAGGTLALTASTTNYIYLNTASSCVPATKTSAFTAGDVPIAVVVTGSSTITSVDDVRSSFTSGITSVNLPALLSTSPYCITTANAGQFLTPDATIAGVIDCSSGLPQVPVFVSGVLRAVKYVNSAGIVAKIDVYPDPSVTDYGDGSVVGTFEWATNLVGAQTTAGHGGEVNCTQGIYPFTTSLLVDWDWITFQGVGKPFWSNGGGTYPTLATPGTPGNCQWEAMTSNMKMVTVGTTTANMHGDFRHKGLAFRDLNFNGNQLAAYAIYDTATTDWSEISESSFMRFITCAVHVGWDSHQIFNDSFQSNAGCGLEEAGIYAQIYGNIFFNNGGIGLSLPSGGFGYATMSGNVFGETPPSGNPCVSLQDTPAPDTFALNTFDNSCAPPNDVAVTGSNHLIYGNTMAERPGVFFIGTGLGSIFTGPSNFGQLEAQATAVGGEADFGFSDSPTHVGDWLLGKNICDSGTNSFEFGYSATGSLPAFCAAIIDSSGNIRAGNVSNSYTIELSQAGGIFGLSVGYNNFTANNLIGTNGYQMNANSFLSWASSGTNSATSKDTGISRISTGLVGIGNGTQGDFSGSLKLNNLTITGTCAGCSGGTATNLSGTTQFSIPYQSASATTGYVSPQTTAGTYALVEVATGSAVAPTLSNAPALSAANMVSFPTFNQNTTGSSASLSIAGQTGLLSFTGLTSTNRVKTVRDAADTILELGGSYTPTGTWTNLQLANASTSGGTNFNYVGNSQMTVATSANTEYWGNFGNSAANIVGIARAGQIQFQINTSTDQVSWPQAAYTNCAALSTVSNAMGCNNSLLTQLNGTTSSIGGSLLTAGTCASGTVTVTGAVVGHTVGVSASDGTLPNALATLSAAVTSTNTVTVQVCAIAAVTPTAKTYNVTTY